ncbi:Succinoglycan biosynthesis protein ExoI [Aquimixticola soesokkakensis]|uniref:Succinoglycan biosynthesis protein ExoI n=1 Tax=Aquimixticola soesokkakensis TaxID=1519096 RepID=A0A1Y5SVP8_9RHOB|nr:thermonuclease family protein [Aquimixticola soesokkakensis]SLN49392.1 Succinoglycan biosynthesis protein ExoI [Aquimixticola soesokkakensis]
MLAVGVLVASVSGVMTAAEAQAGRVLRGAVRVVDGDTLDVGGTRVRLHGVDAPELSQTCKDAGGVTWACGAWSRDQLADLTPNRVRCSETDVDRYGRVVARCFVGNNDVNAMMVTRGAARAYAKYSADYLGAEAQARAAQRGIWQGDNAAPAQYRAEQKTPVVAQTPPQDCAIKGNISANGKLYHMPGTRWYEGTTITLSRGEHWFCSEAQAVAAGWRRAKG